MHARWRAGVGVVVALVAVLVIILVHRHPAVRSAELSNPPLPPPANRLDAMERASQRGERLLEAEAPPFNQVSFGPGTRVVYYRLKVAILGGYVTSDGRLYVVINQGSHDSVNERWLLGLLWAGHITLIPLPPPRFAPELGYAGLDFTEASTPIVPVVSGIDHGSDQYLFVVRPSGVTQVPYRPLVGTLQGTLLSTGEKCYEPDDNNPTPWALFAVDARDHMRPLVSKAEVLRATRGVFGGAVFPSLLCSSFDGRDFITLNSGGDGTVLELTRGRLQLITRGEIIAAGPSRLLICYPVDGPDFTPLYEWDYLEAFAQPFVPGRPVWFGKVLPPRVPHR